ncbi:MAG: hypothetical protein QOG54_400 [Actinomycetota bacterium]|nr:hypothetical protein [Actinomycetota bacterium]
MHLPNLRGSKQNAGKNNEVHCHEEPGPNRDGVGIRVLFKDIRDGVNAERDKEGWYAPSQECPPPPSERTFHVPSVS